VGDHILISESGPIAFKNQAIVRPSIKWITVLMSKMDGRSVEEWSNNRVILRNDVLNYLGE